jgi:hypothetical protein
MPADQSFTDVSAFAVALRELHTQRRGRVVSGRSKRARRAALLLLSKKADDPFSIVA